ncbi:Multidrug resistance protein [Lentibacillus sp. JNUCC-1]|uniref:MFS transporter n=1 Tax=Lentibacillus sp. JNUCC-1 TaxID=2654513 RepID=UPI0012E9434C|nr:MFS transporter [Lentibacillus sp. JNUCC-1]MUV36330.1 Multidrug resistance protein [Lentibacillus sp. JNUCC-1]
MNRILYFIIVVSFLDTFIQLPIITPYARELGASYLLTGAIVAVYSLANMIGNIFGGHWIDRFGRKKMLYSGMFAVAFVLLFYPLPQTGAQLFWVRFFHGLAGGVLIPGAFAYVGDQSKSEKRGKVMALTGASIGTAAIVGPALGGGLSSLGRINYVFWFVAVLFIITGILITIFVKESLVSTDRGKASLAHFLPLLKKRPILQASLAALALMISNGTLAFALPIKVTEMGLTSAATGMLLSTYGVVALIVFLTPLNRMYDRYSPVMLVVAGIATIGFVHVMLNIISISWAVVLLMVVYGVGFALVFPSMNKIIADSSSAIDRGKAYGIFYAFFSLGVIAGSFVSGATAEVFGKPFLSSAGTMIIVVTALLIISKKGQEKQI